MEGDWDWGGDLGGCGRFGDGCWEVSFWRCGGLCVLFEREVADSFTGIYRRSSRGGGMVVEEKLKKSICVYERQAGRTLIRSVS